MLNVEELTRGLTPLYRPNLLPSIDSYQHLEDTFDHCGAPSYLFNADNLNSIDPINYLPSINSTDKNLFDKVKNMSNPNFIAQYREPNLSPTRHPGYKLMRPEYRPGFLTSRSQTMYGGDMCPTPRAFGASDDIALYRPGRFDTTERRSRPMARHQNRLRSLSTNDNDYVHSRGVFTTTTPNVRGHFIIHPDWVSERMTPRK